MIAHPLTSHLQHQAVNGLMRRTPPKENGVDHLNHKKDAVSPPSAHSSASSTPAPPKKNGDDGKPPTPKSGGHRSPSSIENGSSPTLKGLPGPPYGLPGFPPPPGLPTNGSGPSPPDGYPRPPYDPRPPPVASQQPPAGKPYVVRHILPFSPGLAGKNFQQSRLFIFSLKRLEKSELLTKFLPTRPEPLFFSCPLPSLTLHSHTLYTHLFSGPILSTLMEMGRSGRCPSPPTPSWAPASPGTPGRSTPLLTGTWSALSPCRTQPSMCTPVVRAV